MKKWVWLGLIPAAVVAQESHEDNYGYSFFTIGVENVTYEEVGSTSSTVTLTNPVLNTGGLYRINNQWDFSIEAYATFAPQNATEEWRWNDRQLGYGVHQTNQVEYLKTATNAQIHYKLGNDWRLVAGPSMTYQTYTRYGMKNTSSTGNKYFYGTWEETSTDIFIDAGIAYDDATLFADDKWHVAAKAVVGIPLWSQTENTQFEDVTFNDFGIRTNVEGTISYEVVEGLHLGWYAMLGFEKRFESDTQNVTVTYCNTMVDGECTQYVTENKRAYLPEADTFTFSTGLQALWNF